MHEINIQNHQFQKYIKKFKSGDIVFKEGDPSQDLYILEEGSLEVLKGENKLADIMEKGSPFGEMSFLLGAERTATVRSVTASITICIPKKEITTFLAHFPDIAHQISRSLAESLDETTQVLYKIKEFCNQLPDAVIITDKDCRLITWNTAAENLYGRDLNSIRDRSVEEIYEVPGIYKTLLDEVQSKHNLREKILTIRNPQKGIRHVSTSSTALYDTRGNFEGFLSIGRDVTEAMTIEKKYEKVKFRYLPALVIVSLLTGGLVVSLLLFW